MAHADSDREISPEVLSRSDVEGEIPFLARTISRLTGLDVFFRDNQQWVHIPSDQTPPGLADAIDPVDIATRFSADVSITTITTITTHVVDEYGLSWLAGSCRRTPILTGPFIAGTLTEKGSRFLRRFAALPPSRTAEELQGVADLLYALNLDWSDRASAPASASAHWQENEPALVHRIDIAGVHNPAMDEANQFSREEIDERYEYEHRIRDAVSRGDRNALSKAIGDGFRTRDFYHRLPGNPLRIEKSLTVVLNTLLRLSAEQGGLMPLMVHGISEEYALRIQQARSVEEMAPLRSEMMYRYCEAVRQFTATHHSAPVRAVIRHILNDLGENHTLAELSQIAGCSPSYLARLFRRETGTSPGGFLREQRVSQARWLLSNTDQPIAEIADALGFSSLNYFRRVFRGETGASPGVYRRRYRKA